MPPHDSPKAFASAADPLAAELRASPISRVFGRGALTRLGELTRELPARCALLVTDPGLTSVGHVARAVRCLESAGVEVLLFDQVGENPTTEHVARGLSVARAGRIDAIVGLGGGSAMDCAKGINLLLSCGGRMQDYRGDPTPESLVSRPPLRPMILVPTTGGTGSEAQSFALISDAESHQKMACGDRRAPREGGLRPRIALLDSELLVTQPRAVAAHAGIDAVTHAVETAASRRRTIHSRRLSAAAWRTLHAALPRALNRMEDVGAWGEMLLGAHAAGAAIEESMLGAAHACANPLTAVHDVTHGVAVGLMMPHVVRFNSAGGENPYADLDDDPLRLASELERLLETADLPRRLREVGVESSHLPRLAASAAEQWTAGFNPRPVGASELLSLYEAAR